MLKKAMNATTITFQTTTFDQIVHKLILPFFTLITLFRASFHYCISSKCHLAFWPLTADLPKSFSHMCIKSCEKI